MRAVVLGTLLAGALAVLSGCSGGLFPTVTESKIASASSEKALSPQSLLLPIAPNFSATPVAGDSPLSVTFTSTSYGPFVKAWLWEFGDGSQSTERNPTHVYTTGGTYTVKLTVTWTLGRGIRAIQFTSSRTRSDYIVVRSSGLPDLVVSSITLTYANGFQLGNSAAYFVQLAVTITNQGTAPSGAWLLEVAFYATASLPGWADIQPIPALAAGAAVTLTTSIHIVQLGDTIQAIADYNGFVVNESDEANNLSSYVFTL